MRIGFLFNHDQIHQVAHSLPIALALAEADLPVEILLATTNARIETEIRQLAGERQGDVRIVPLRLRSRVTKAVAAVSNRFAPSAKLLIYRDNLDFFRSLDVLVVAEKTSLLLKNRYGLERLKIVHTRHGAGDRAIGFDRASAAFDHVLVPGIKVRDRLIAEAGVDANRISVVGYPKFDLFARSGPASRAPNGRTTILYNPHVSPHLSSWYGLGRDVLDWFVDHPEYDLIFAPHVMLFERGLVASIDRMRLRRPGRLAKRYYDAPNIQIDLGSRASTTMAYTNVADIYLGDVSSQIYEFLRYPRPCLFLNHPRRDWRGDPNYLHWTAGTVIDDLAQLGPALAAASSDHAGRYGDVQRRLLQQTFDISETPSSVRAARAIAAMAAIPWPDSGSRSRAEREEASAPRLRHG